MLVVCIDDRTRSKSRKLLKVNKTYKATIDKSRPNCYKIIIDKKDIKKDAVKKDTVPVTRFFRKERFVVKRK